MTVAFAGSDSFPILSSASEVSFYCKEEERLDQVQSIWNTCTRSSGTFQFRCSSDNTTKQLDAPVSIDEKVLSTSVLLSFDFAMSEL